MNFFDSFIRPNQRLRIRSLSLESIWLKLLYGLSKIFDYKLESLLSVRGNIWLASSTGEGLNAWGKRYNIVRLENESDADFKTRIFSKRLLAKSAVSRKQKAVILENLLALPENSIRLENASQSSGFKMGDPIGTGIMSREFYFFAYTVFIERELSQEQKLILTNYINLVNIGGNYPLFANLKPPFTIMSMGGRIGDSIVSKENSINKIYIYF